MSYVDVYATNNNFSLYSGNEVREIELNYCQQQQISSYQLMERAGIGLWEFIQQRFPEAISILVLTGPGNNAGDGFEIARLAEAAGKKVRLGFVNKNHHLKTYLDSISGDAAIALERIQKQTNLTLEAVESIQDFNVDLIIDGILGSGIKAPAREQFIIAIEKINASETDVLSIDIPSGINADSGCIIGAAVKATATLSFIGVKSGLVTAEGKQCSGELYLDELNLQSKWLHSKSRRQPIQLVKLQTEVSQCSKQLLSRTANSHKGSFGRTLIIGGNYGMGGAALLAASAAYRSGSGAVMMITRSEHISAALERNPEIMAIASDDLADVDSIEIALQVLDSASTIVVGPGLGNDDWAEFWLQQALSKDVATVVDADGLRLAKRLEFSLAGTIITPHPGEAKVLIENNPIDNETENNLLPIQQNRYAAVVALQKLTQAVVILKGAGSLVAAATGTDEISIKVCPYGNSGMATAGMGDVLAGIIGALLSQGFAKSEAAIIGTLIHSISGDRAAAEQPIGMVASDLMPFIRQLRNEISGY